LTRVGVLALQGDFAEHRQMLQRLGAEVVEVRLPVHLQGVDGLIIPGGESTTIRRLMDLYDLADLVVQRAQQGMPVWGTCAGAIILARQLTDDRPQPLGLLDMVVTRNAFGRQVDSFEEEILIPVLGPERFHAVFIRAPIVERVGPEVEVLAQLPDGRIVAIQQKRLLATSFHPELTSDTRFHAHFLKLMEAAS